ncbi:MAG: hypothetical protein RL026_2178 [Pseudomonadota bacterium]|jgi:pimeloyl-ACP methyl ester carboxylesterase
MTVCRLFRRLGFALLPALAATLPAGAATPAPGLSFSPCQLEHPQQLLSLSAQCATLDVPEDRSQPEGRRLQLAVFRMPAVTRKPAADPLFVLAGGPGMGASEFYANLSVAFRAARRERDIILMDQRGTGRSGRLGCGLDDDARMAVEADAATLAALLQECRTTLAKDHDLRQYTTSVAVADLEALRQALGAERISLYGVSYGTRVAQHYARRFPARVRGMVLDGVVPADEVLGPGIALDAQRALDRVLARCAADSACSGRFGDLPAQLQRLRERLQQSPVQLQLTHPRSGAPITVDFTADALAVALRLGTYASSSAALLPVALHEAGTAGNFRPLASLYLLAGSSVGEAIAYGMHNSVVCAEDAPRFEGRIDRAALQATFMGTSQIDLLQSMCADWPRGPVDADFHQPLRSSVPTLLLSGSADPVTPASHAARVARGLRHALHIELPDQGHGQIGQPCMDRILADFLQRADQATALASLDQRCLARLRPAPFFLSMSGPAP